jgi:excisionase family DNA binding protein
MNAGNRGRLVTKLRTITETAEVLNVSPRTVRRLIESGDLQVYRFGRLVRIADGDIVVLLAANRSF